MVVSTKLRVGVASQASVAVGGVNCGVDVHSMVLLLPCPLSTGAVLSTTVMVSLTGALTLPQSSVPLHVLLIE